MFEKLTQGQNENSESMKSTLGDLILKYKGIGNIPDTDLAIIGYIRDENGRVEKNYSDQEKNEVLRDVLSVGPSKPLGYLPIDTIVRFGNLEEVKNELSSRGLKILQLTAEESGKNGEVLYVYDDVSLSTLLKENHLTLEEAGWPVDAESYIRCLKELVPKDSALFSLIAKSFADPTEWGNKKLDT